MDVPPSAGREVFGWSPDYGRGCPVQRAGRARSGAASCRSGPAEGRRPAVGIFGARSVHRRRENAVAIGHDAHLARCAGDLSQTRGRGSLQERQFRGDLQRQYSAESDRDERPLEGRAVRAGREDRADPQSILVRRRQGGQAPAVSERTGVPRGSRSGRGGSEVQSRRARRARQSSRRTIAITRTTRRKATTRSTIWGPRTTAASSGST